MAQMTSSTPSSTPSGGDGRAGLSGGAIASLSGGVLLLIFILQNTGDVNLDFLFWDFTWPLWLLTIVSALLGALVFFGIGVMRRHRRRKERRAERRSSVALDGDLDVLGIVRGAHAEPPLAAHVVGVLARWDGEDVDLHVGVVHLAVVTIIDFGQVEWQFFSRMSGRPIDSHWSTATQRLNVMMPTSGSGISNEQVERLARHRRGVHLEVLHPVRDRCCR